MLTAQTKANMTAIVQPQACERRTQSSPNQRGSHAVFGFSNVQVISRDPRKVRVKKMRRGIVSLIRNGKNGVLRKLKHIFPNTYQRIKSICSPAKGGTGCYRLNYQPGS